MADLDRELTSRLSRLAAAVPVAPGHLDPVHRSAVAARQGVRLAWITPVVVLAVAAALSIGPFAPAATDGNGPVEATTKSGDFELRIRSEKAQYESGEAIEITASLTYVGPERSIRITHGRLAGGGPIGFGILEPVIGNLHLGTTVLDSRNSTELRRGEALAEPFAKGAAWSGDDPRSDAYASFLEDPVLRLGPGTWHVTATTSFQLGDRGDSVALHVRVAIEVLPPASALPNRTLSPDEPVVATDTEGQFELMLHSAKSRYAAGEPIEIKAALTNVGAESVEIAHALGVRGTPLGFGVEEPVIGDLRLGPGWDLACVRTTLDRDLPLTQPFWKSGGWPSDHPRADEYHRYILDPVLRLSEGTWHVYAVAEFSLGDCSADPIRMRVDIVIEVERA